MSSLQVVLQIMDEFSNFLGIRVNWEKSLILTLSLSHPRSPINILLCWVDRFKYLGVYVGATLVTFMDLNLLSLLGLFSQRWTFWQSLSVTPVGRVNLIKMI